MSLSKALGAGVMLWAGVEASYYVWLKLRSRNADVNDPKDDEPVNTVLFFDSRSPECYMNIHDIEKCEMENCPRRNMRVIENCLGRAKSSIDVAMYRLSSVSLASYLVKAIKNGVKVRVITDGDKGENPTESKAVITLRQAGAFVRVKKYETNKRRDHLLMHHKFVVIDNKVMVTGSLNWTTTAISGNWEDAAILTDSSIVGKFISEFQYLWDNIETPEDLLPPPANPAVFPSDLSVWKRSAFSEAFMFNDWTADCRGHMSPIKFERQPENHAPLCAYTMLHNLCELLDTAEKSIDICLLLLNLENVADVFLQAHFKGLKVRMITDSHMGTLSGAQARSLIEQGVEVRGMHYHSNMHHKFIILDNKLVFFGSLNWSMQALCGNAENLVCTNNEALVGRFAEQFNALWEFFQPVEVEKLGQRRFN